jgi:hypothetical protein
VEIVMTKLPLLLAPALLLAAGCSQKTQDASANLADSASADANATTQNAIDDVNAASDHAMNAAQNAADQASPTFNHAMDKVGNAADRAQHATGKALKDAGNAIE